MSVKFAVFVCDRDSHTILSRCDDGYSGLDMAEALQWTVRTPKVTTAVAPAVITIQQRADFFSTHWSLDKRYLPCQLFKSPCEISQMLVESKSAPKIKYAILITPRSGSTLLSEIIGSTGMLGYPIEYFVPDVVRAISLTFSDLFSSYEDLICSGFKSRNGVFGLEIEGERFFSERALLSDLRNWRLIYLTRYNILAQAISNAFAIRSGTWHSFVSCEQSQTATRTVFHC